MTGELAASSNRCGIAIIGMSGRFPGAGCIGDFWKNLRDGVESISVLSEADLDAAGVAARRRLDPRYVRSAALLEGIEFFDAAFFDMPAREAQITDPQHRLFLECTWHALEDAGCDPARYRGEIGIFAGAGRNTYFLHNISGDETLKETLDDYQIIIGSEDDYLATRVAFKLNLRGPAITVQTACSTSLVAVHMACRSLLEWGMPDGVGGRRFACGFRRRRAISTRTAACTPRTGIPALLMLALAERSLARESVSLFSSHLRPHWRTAIQFVPSFVVPPSIMMGRRKPGITAPSAAGQAAAIRKALAAARIDPATIDYVEAHGTGTLKGDPVEIEAESSLRSAPGAARRPSAPSAR